MKKMTFLVCAAICTCAVAFTGCNSDKEKEPQKVPSVTTDITISLPANASGGNTARRMPGTTVQANDGVDDFQGMGNIILIPFGLAKNATVDEADTKIGNALEGITDIAATSELAATSKAKKYESVAVPTGTSAFLFYAESKVASIATPTKFQKGSLTYVQSTTTAGATKFELEAIQPNSIAANAALTGLLAYVQSVADATDGTKAWKLYTSSDNEGFAQLFAEYKKTKNLNSFNIQRMMNDLLASIALTDNTLADNMRAAIKSDTYVTYDGETKKVTLKPAYAGFPASIDLPDGAISIAYDDDNNEFGSSADKSFASRAAAEMQVAPTELYTYPASLWYYANTTISTSDESESAALADATHDWEWVLGQYGAANGSVNSKTRSIALTNPINYAVGRLDVQVKLGSAALQDAALPTAASIPCNEEGQRFTLTGVLVGGQKNVGFDLTPGTYPASSPDYTIYDKVMTNTINVTTALGSANHTLVLETLPYGETGADVMIAIELLNNTGVDFVGADGVVPAGGKFYLVGKLEAENATTTPKKVFLKDYTTTAQLNIVDLKHAYNGIPDLRTPTLEIGLSVDLNWTAGTTYIVNL